MNFIEEFFVHYLLKGESNYDAITSFVTNPFRNVRQGETETEEKNRRYRVDSDYHDWNRAVSQVTGARKRLASSMKFTNGLA